MAALRKRREHVEPAPELLLLGRLDGAVVNHLLQARRLLADEAAVGRRLVHHLEVVLGRLVAHAKRLCLCHQPRLVCCGAKLLRDRVELLDLPRQADPHTRLLLHEPQERVALLLAAVDHRRLVGARALEPETVLREVVRLNGEALSNVGIVLVAILRHADVAAQQRGGRLANLLCEVLPRVVLVAIRILLVKADNDSAGAVDDLVERGVVELENAAVDVAERRREEERDDGHSVAWRWSCDVCLP
mmetsp:Transcript_14991/g.48151  ORF Transcript_14991/g.48151 Transcript_14991/m.48151 type:complete len:246 (+) Transcript_14991:224-961(+)